MSDRHALKKQYLEDAVQAGVFIIKNKVNNRVFVGGSLNVQGTMNRNRFELKHRSHRNDKLLKDWIQHGPENFVFEVIDIVEESDDPSFDQEKEVELLTEMYRQEYGSRGENGYNRPGPGLKREG